LNLPFTGTVMIVAKNIERVFTQWKSA